MKDLDHEQGRKRLRGRGTATTGVGEITTGATDVYMQSVTYGVGWALVSMVAEKKAMVATISAMRVVEWLTAKKRV